MYIVHKQDSCIKVANRTLRKVGNLHIKLKDPISKWEASSVVYKVECFGCEATYVGQTSQILKSKITAHKRDMRGRHNVCTLSMRTNLG